MHPQKFFLINLNLKLQVCTKASFSLLLILLDVSLMSVSSCGPGSDVETLGPWASPGSENSEERSLVSHQQFSAIKQHHTTTSRDRHFE